MNEQIKLSDFKKTLTPEEREKILEELPGVVAEVFKKIDDVTSPLEKGEALISREIHEDVSTQETNGPKVIYSERHEYSLGFIVDDGMGGTWRKTWLLGPNATGQFTKERLK